MLTLKKINLFLGDNTIMEPEEIRILQNNLKNPATQESALKTAVSMAQRGHDTSALCTEVLKTANTGSLRLKIFCNVFFKYSAATRPACQLLCTHSLLKDFNDKFWQVQRSAVLDSVLLSDEIIVRNYVYDLKRMSMHSRHEIRAASAHSLGIVYLKAPLLFFEQSLHSVLRTLVHDQNRQVAVTALRSAATVEAAAGCSAAQSQPELLTIEEILSLIEKHREAETTDVVRAAMGLLVYKSRHCLKTVPCLSLDSLEADTAAEMACQAGSASCKPGNIPGQYAARNIERNTEKRGTTSASDETISLTDTATRLYALLRSLLRAADVSVFFLAARILMDEAENSSYDSECLLREILDRAMGFAHLRPEQLHNILVLAQRLAEHIDFSPLCFAIKSTDPEFIKKGKIRLLLHKKHLLPYDTIKHQLLQYGNRLDLLGECLRYDFPLPRLLFHFKTADSVRLLLLIRNSPVGTHWGESLSSFLHNNIAILNNQLILNHPSAIDSASYSPAITEEAAPSPPADNCPVTDSPVHVIHDDVIDSTDDSAALAIKLALELVGKFCTFIPDWADQLSYSAYPLDFLCLYCRLKCAGSISSEQCLGYLKNLSRAAPHIKRIKIVMKQLEHIDPESIHRLATDIEQCATVAMAEHLPAAPPQ